MTEEEWDGGGALQGDEGKNIYRLRLRKVDFLNHGFTEGALAVNKELENTDEGRLRRERQLKRENEALARHLEKEFGGDGEERNRKVARKVEQATGSLERPKRKFEDDVQN